MKITMVWGQRHCSFESEFSPELLEAMSEYADDDNPDVINEAYKRHLASGDFSHVAIVEANIKSGVIEDILSTMKIELEDIHII